MRLGIVGCGQVSESYIESSAVHSDLLHVVACADVARPLAERRAEQFGVPRVHDVEALLADPEVDIVVNLTPAGVHAEVTLAAIAAGKHVYTEKPLAQSVEAGERIVAAARAAGVSVGSAPATFLGGGLQTCRKIIDDGWIGEPRAATAFFTSRGNERWHAHVDHFYAPGGGPMLDVGPYLFSALVSWFGPVRRVSASTRRFEESRVRGREFAGARDVPVQVSTHAAGTVDFHSGAIVTVITSWEMWTSSLPYIEIYGSEGVLSTPDPNLFTGSPRLRRGERQDLSDKPYRPFGGDWRDVPMAFSGDVGRAVGIAEMADAIQTGRPIRAGLEMAFHVLEVMEAFERSSERGTHVEITSTCGRPAPLPVVPAGDEPRF